MASLTERQRRFVEAYVREPDARAAYAAAGYAARPGRADNSWTIRNMPKVKAEIARRLKARDIDGYMADPANQALTPKQAAFVAAYVTDLNATAAARAAGYVLAGRSGAGQRLLRQANVAAAVERRLAEKLAAARVTPDRLLAELGRVGFADAAAVLDPAATGEALGPAVEVKVRRRGEEIIEERRFRPDLKVRVLLDLYRGAGRGAAARTDGAAQTPPAPPAWSPLPGPQTLAYNSTADVIGYGGAAGGGKTDLALGLALTRHLQTAIFRREATQLSGIIERLAGLTGGRAGYNAGQRVWRLPGRRIEFGSAPHPGDELRHQGRPKDLLVLDEAQHFLESQARFLMGWVRSAQPGQKCTTLLTFNPPTSAEGRWLISYFAPWLDPAHPNPARPGELRWFAVVDGREVEVDGPEPFLVLPDGAVAYPETHQTSSSPRKRGPMVEHTEAAGNGGAGAPPSHGPASVPSMGPRFRGDDDVFLDEALIHPTSRTFIASRVADNPHLAGTGYLATLQALPEPVRSQMLDGDFSAGIEDDPWQVIPSAWVDEAMARWEPGCIKPMDAMGVDVARGGRDATIIARRHGTWFDELLCLPGPATPDGPSVAGAVMARRSDYAVVHIDVVGWGASPFDVLKANGLHAEAVNGAARALGKADAGGLSFVNRRAELWWRMREALDPYADAPIALPPDPALKADLCAPRWRQSAGGIQIEAKEDIVRRIGRSPDRGDAACLALIATPKLIERPRRPRAPAGSWMG